jgi:hypothetical protein
VLTRRGKLEMDWIKLISTGCMPVAAACAMRVGPEPPAGRAPGPARHG